MRITLAIVLNVIVFITLFLTILTPGNILTKIGFIAFLSLIASILLIYSLFIFNSKKTWALIGIVNSLIALIRILLFFN